jgi:hypothetical protein
MICERMLRESAAGFPFSFIIDDEAGDIGVRLQVDKH